MQWVVWKIKPNPLFEKWAGEDIEGFKHFAELLLQSLGEYIKYTKGVSHR